MMRYVTIRAWQEQRGESWQERPSAMVYEREDGPIATGLYDQHGAPLYRVEERTPLGFDLSGKPRIRVRAVSR